MKLDIKTDFTRLPRAERLLRAADAGDEAVSGMVVLAHDERHLRRKVLTRTDGGRLLVDLLEPAALEDGDVLVGDDGMRIGIGAAEEEVYEVRAHDGTHLARLCWHIGSCRLAAQIEADRILILRDPAVRTMLEGLGAKVSEIVAPFVPVHDAYSGHDHGERDRYGRRPGDPHYGHDHA